MMFNEVHGRAKTFSWRGRNRAFSLMLMAVSLFGAATQGTAQQADSDAGCANLAKLAIPEATITMAKVVQSTEFKFPETHDNRPPGGAGSPGGQQGGPGGPPPGGPGGNAMSLAPFYPKDTTNHVPFCRIAATLTPSGDSTIKVEVWMPVTGWNGKMMGAGDFGWAGHIMYAGLLVALEHGFAAVSTDTGHDESLENGAFAVGHPDKMIDYGYRAAHAMTVYAKQVIASFYGKPASHAYWFGCSLGGQMGMTEIQRFPEDYDGAIIGAPANPIVDLNFYQIWPSLLITEKPARQLGREKASMLAAAVMAKCDALDGAKDGEIENPLACDFDPATLLCKGTDDDKCLTPPQLEFVQMLYTGPVDAKGHKRHTGAAKGTEASFGGYTADGAMGVATALFKYMIFQDPNWDWKTLNIDHDIDYGNAVLNTVNVADNPNLKPFFDRGGKLLLYHGWNDGNSPLTNIEYMDAVKKTVGVAQTEDSMRLFAIPAMGHCSGGSGCDTFDKLAVLDAWKETGKAPETIIASKVQNGKVVRTHPICAWPMVASYRGSGDLKDAANFACVKK